MLKKLLSDTGIYGLSSILGRLIGYILVPLHTDVFSPESYGNISTFFAYAVFFNIVYTHGMETAYFRFSTKKPEDKEATFNATMSSVLFASLTLSFFLILFAEPLSNLLELSAATSSYKAKIIRILGGIFAIDAIAAIPFAKLRIQGKAKKFAIIKLSNISINLFLNFFFLIFCQDVYDGKYLPELKPIVEFIYFPKWEITYVFIANLIANFLLIPLLWKSFIGFKITINRSLLKPIYEYALPLLVAGVAFSVNEVLDRILLPAWLPEGFHEGFNNIEALGIYSACYKLSIFITLAVQAYKYAVEPFFFSHAERKDSLEIFAVIMKYFVISCTIMLIAVCANVDLLAFAFIRQESFRTGLGVVPILLMANIFLGIYHSLSVWYKVTDKTYFGALISSIGAFITILANFLLIPILGYYGSAMATLLCYFSMATVSYILGRKYYPVPYSLFSIIFYLGLSSLISWLTLQIQIENMFLCFFVKNIMVLAYIFGFLLIEKKELKRVINMK